ncbi:VanZ family protein [Alkalicella caledoniensis]|uniref:VanZ family protein n=1 Tax=Alkalicella caledoniensis TaxID=2731377 RepID=A0A7G9W4A8_ALKCA|nr:VanZ family protein [Alkalicella caledoniensis]QNO13520.1 VanZ family protein [Alkalicella caledoniensis]
MLDISFLVLISIPIYLTVLLVGIKKKYSLQKQLLIFGFFAYLVAVVAVTLFPFPVQRNLIEHRREINYISNNFIPFKTILETINQGYGIRRALGGNLVLLMPLSIFLPLLSNKYMNISKITLIALTTSIGIELAQFTFSLFLGFNYRMTNIDDVILNTIGALISFIIFMPIAKYLKKTVQLSI